MSTLIRSAKIVDPKSKHHGKVIDLLLSRGRIEKMAKSIKTKATKVIELPNLHISAGWVDMLANFCDPGFEYKEDLQSGLKAAANGGFTRVCISPQTEPNVQSKAQVEYILSQTKNNLVKAEVLAAASENLKGEQLAEFYDLSRAGAVAFYNGDKAISNSSCVLKASLYLTMFDGLLYCFSEDADLAGNGLMHEGTVSTKLGMKGIPSLAEELMLKRDLGLASYTGGRLHFVKISSVEGLNLLKKEKKLNTQISVGVAAHQLYFEDSDLERFDTNLKVSPPFRSSSDRKKLVNGILDGTIDTVCSDHNPQDVESKFMEFENAEIGMSGIEFAYSALRTSTELSIERTVELLSENPRRLLKLEEITLEEGSAAEITLFNPDLEWIPSSKDSASKSRNCPYFGEHLLGKAYGVIRGSKVHLNL